MENKEPIDIEITEKKIESKQQESPPIQEKAGALVETELNSAGRNYI